MKVPASVVKARRERLAERIESEGYLHLDELCRKMGVSVATARRDLAHLHSKGRISRVRGGALHRGRTAPGSPIGEAGHQRHSIRARDELAAAIFESPDACALKAALCDAGRRAWARGLIAGTSGHLSARLGDRVLSSPAGVARGAMRSEMICMADLGGTPAATRGHWRPSPEVSADMAIYQAVSQAGAVIHAHAPHATAFAVSGIEPPRGLLAEFEVFVGVIGHIDYRTPGSAELAAIIGQLAPRHPAILLKNHGVICWGTSVEDALSRLEMTESYCQMASIAARLPGHLTHLAEQELNRLLDVKQRLGIPDVRLRT